MWGGVGKGGRGEAFKSQFNVSNPSKKACLIAHTEQ